MQARAQDLDYTQHERGVFYNYRVCSCILLPALVSCHNSGLICLVYAHQGPPISVVLNLHIAKAEQRLCIEILAKVTVQLSLLCGTRSNVEVEYKDIKRKLYTNSPVNDFPKDDLRLMYEKIDPWTERDTRRTRNFVNNFSWLALYPALGVH